MRQQDQRKIHPARDDAEVAQRVVWQLAVDMRIHRQRPGRSAGNGVAIGGGCHQGLQTDDAVGAGAVVDDDLLADSFRELLADDARHEIGAAAGREHHDHADGFVGVGLS